MRPTPLHGINGRLRQHITRVGAAYANRISSPQKAITEDEYLRGLLHGGSVTEEQLQKAIEGYNRIPSNFVWLQEVDDSILDTADNVFLAKYGRDPTEDADFRSNGDYHKICKNLKRDHRHYDADLEKLRPDYKGHPAQQGDQRGTRAESPAVQARLVRNKMMYVIVIIFYAGAIGLLLSGGLERLPSDAVVPLVLLMTASPFIFCLLPTNCCSNCRRGYRERFFGGPYVCKGCGARLRR